MKLFIGEAVHYLGPWRGFVSRTDDPDKQFRIKALVPEVLGEQESNWALPCFGGGSDDPKLPAIGQMVWFEFERGDPNFPVWKGCTPSSYQGELPLPLESQGEDGDTVLPPRGTAEEALTSGNTLKEPYPAFVGEYPGVQSRKTESGHHLEVDDTPNGERLAAIHRTGNGVEIDEFGSMRRRLAREDAVCTGDKSERVMGKKIILCEGPMESEFRKEVAMMAKAKAGYTFLDNVQVVLNGADNVVQCNGVLEITGGGQLKISLGSALSQTVAGNLQQGVMGSHEVMVTENAQETIGNASLRAVGKKISVVTGNYVVEALAGQTILNSNLAVRLGSEVLAIHPVIKGMEFMALLNAFINWAITHTHPDPVSGSTGTPTPPWTGGFMTPGVHLSGKVYVE